MVKTVSFKLAGSLKQGSKLQIMWFVVFCLLSSCQLSVSRTVTPVPSTQLFGASPTPTAIKTPTPFQPRTTFYVSPSGANTNGRSWFTAWRDFDQIQWDVVEPGDMIVIRGGKYHTQLKIEKNGSPSLPILITTDGEQVILDGGMPPLPYCGQLNYQSGVSEDAIDLGEHKYIILDGRDWSGFIVRNYKRGIRMEAEARSIVVRNVEIYANGYASGSGSDIAPTGPGVRLGGTDILFERVIIHDNGQDAFQAGRGVWNFTLRYSWLYNSRPHPEKPGLPFNYCSHTDGIQVYDGGLQGPMLIENSIIGPSFTQGIIIGSKATVNDAVIRNSLFVGSENAGLIISDGGVSSNWTLENITIVQDTAGERWNLKLNGKGHHLIDSVFYGGAWGLGVFEQAEAVGNIRWLTPDMYAIAVEIDPMFVDGEYGLTEGPDFADFDFSVQNPAVPTGTGSAITSVRQLLESAPHVSDPWQALLQGLIPCCE